MTNRISFFSTIKNRQILWLVVLALPALFIHLGLIPLKGDEAIRALVALEMMLSHDYITPTLNGELYFNKPPLFNWVLIGVFRLFHHSSEFLIRLPTLAFLTLYCMTIYYWVKKFLGKQLGILSSLVFLTCGRILFWDSFLGLIDIAYSWITFLLFMLVWHYFRQRKFLRLFIVSYVLTAIGFMLKGIPSLAFQAITLLVLFISGKRFKKLLSWQHVLGIFVFLVIAGSYFLLYYLKHPDHMETYLMRLFFESADKSALGAEIKDTFLHIIAFPFEVLYHFAPWTILVAFLFHKKIVKRTFSNAFNRYCILVFLANIVVYWLSPTTYPRYLLMLMPLLFIVFLYAGKMHALSNTMLYRIMKKTLMWVTVVLAVTSFALPVLFVHQLPVNQVIGKAVLILLAELLILYVFYIRRKKISLLFVFGLLLLISRISFDVFLVPYRNSTTWADLCRQDAIELGKITEGQELYLLTDTMMIPNAYYITREREEILKFVEKPVDGPYYIVSDTTAFDLNFKKEFTMRIPNDKKYFYAGKYVTEP